MKMADNCSALQVKAMARKMQKGILPLSRAVKSITTHPTASSWWRLNFFDLVITNRDGTKVNQTKQTNKLHSSAEHVLPNTAVSGVQEIEEQFTGELSDKGLWISILKLRTQRHQQ